MAATGRSLFHASETANRMAKYFLENLSSCIDNAYTLGYINCVDANDEHETRRREMKKTTTSKMMNGPLSLAEEIKIAQQAAKYVNANTPAELSDEVIRVRQIMFSNERREIETTYRMRIAG